MADEEKKKLTPLQTFEGQIKDRLLQDIGSLMPDDVLAEMVKRAIDDAFFQKRDQYVPRSFGAPDKVEKEPLFVETIRELIKKQVRQEIEEWLDRNHNEVAKLIQDEVSQGVPQLIMKHLQVRWENSTRIFADNILREILHNHP